MREVSIQLPSRQYLKKELNFIELVKVLVREEVGAFRAGQETLYTFAIKRATGHSLGSPFVSESASGFPGQDPWSPCRAPLRFWGSNHLRINRNTHGREDTQETKQHVYVSTRKFPRKKSLRSLNKSET